MKKILITGASGFIGSFIVEEALKRGFETWAAVRKKQLKEVSKRQQNTFYRARPGQPGQAGEAAERTAV